MIESDAAIGAVRFNNSIDAPADVLVPCYNRHALLTAWSFAALASAIISRQARSQRPAARLRLLRRRAGVALSGQSADQRRLLCWLKGLCRQTAHARPS